MTGLGVVAIGRNEGQRLRLCLESLSGLGVTVVYVDSGSTDGSVALAGSSAAEVVELDMARPFTAARGRNAGFARLLEVDPGVRFVQFLDGDCEVADGWLDLARRALEARPEAAVVFGLRREKFPERSVYNRVADIEWNVPIGGALGSAGVGATEALSCGGDALFRADALRAVGGYDPTMPACEEPELCQRLRRAGWSVVRLDAEMTRHDAALLRFGPWARRVFRTGYGGMDFTTRFGGGADDPFRKQVRSARLWTVGWSLAFAAGTGLAALLAGPAAGLVAAVLVAAVLPAQAARVAVKNRARAGGLKAAAAYGVLVVVSKWIQLAGQVAYARDRRAGRHARLIEYKRADPGTAAAAPGSCEPAAASAPTRGSAR